MDIKKWAIFGGVGACGGLCVLSSAGLLTMLGTGAVGSYFTNPFLSFGGILLLSGMALIGYRFYKRSLGTTKETKSDLPITEHNGKCC